MDLNKISIALWPVGVDNVFAHVTVGLTWHILIRGPMQHKNHAQSSGDLHGSLLLREPPLNTICSHIYNMYSKILAPPVGVCGLKTERGLNSPTHSINAASAMGVHIEIIRAEFCEVGHGGLFMATC